MKSKYLLIVTLFASFAVAHAKELTVTVKDHKFIPDKLQIGANEKVKITFINNDDSIEEFDSRDLNVEKVVMQKSQGAFFIGPLKPGVYKFRGEFHEATAKGTVVVK